MGSNASEKAYVRLLEKLESLREMLRTTFALEGLGLTAAVFLGIVLVGFALDNLFWLSAGIRIILLVGGLSAVVFLLVLRIIRPLARKVSNERVAIVLEKAYPGLDNAVINAVQLGRDRLEGYSRLVADEIVKDADLEVKTLELPKAVERRRLKRYSIAAAVAAGAVLLYVVAFPAHFANAFERYSHFSTYVPPITKTKIEIEPGNITLRSGEDLVVTCTPSGNVPDGAQIQFGDGSRLSMQFEGGRFAYRLADVTEPITYVVYAGDARSPDFKVNVIYVPTVERVTITYEYPEYTGLSDRIVENTTGDLDAVEGTNAYVKAEYSKDVNFASFEFGGGIYQAECDNKTVSWSVPVKKTVTYTIRLVDMWEYDNSYTYQVTARKDAPPKVVITRPARDVTYATGEGKKSFPINFRATDDMGVRKCVLMMSYGGSEPVPIRNWHYEGGKKDVSDGYVWEIDTDKMGAGQVVTYFVSAEDGRPGEAGLAVSKTYRVKVVEPRSKRIEAIKSLVEVHSRLRDMLKLQVRNLERTTSLVSYLKTTNSMDKSSTKTLERAHQDQRKIRDLADGVTSDLSSASEFERVVKDTLLTLISNEMLEAVRELEKSLRTQTCDKRVKMLQTSVVWQEKIIIVLKNLLEEIPSLIKRLEKDEENIGEFEDEDLNLKKEFARNLVDGLEEFLEEQKKIIKMSEELMKKAVEDWTEGDEKTLAELERVEHDWSKWFKDMADDLSRLPDQDMSDSKMCEELIEIYEEVELAKDALTRREVEIAVPHEQAGAEMAEELTENIERWLPDVRDYKKWVMEDIPDTQEVPLVDLPDELEDIIGDLIEEEEELSEDADDVSSAWADSLDKGAGWGNSDGPISNMSAKGVTGNTLPNNNEIGGRSGEGRSGKSSGQMVEKTATGKGGRKTPTRLTPDPFEAGSVEDKSKDPVGGSTGGGKLSGGGEDGLRGPTAPQIKEQMQRLARQQAQILSKSERMGHNLKNASLPSGDLDVAVSAMKQAENCLKNSDLNGFQKHKKIAVENLEDAKRVIATEVRARREQALAIPKDMREELINARDEKFPREYRDLLGDYYRALANPDSKKTEDK